MAPHIGALTRRARPRFNSSNLTSRIRAMNGKSIQARIDAAHRVDKRVIAQSR
jgi:hypothetical protein